MKINDIKICKQTNMSTYVFFYVLSADVLINIDIREQDNWRIRISVLTISFLGVLIKIHIVTNTVMLKNISVLENVNI